jgi:hypothetical protein
MRVVPLGFGYDLRLMGVGGVPGVLGASRVFPTIRANDIVRLGAGLSADTVTVGALLLNGACAGVARFAGDPSACCSRRSIVSRRPGATSSLLRGASRCWIELLIGSGTAAVSAFRDIGWANPGAKREPLPLRWALGRSQSQLLLTVACDATTSISLLELVQSSLLTGLRWDTLARPVGS